MPVDLLTGWPGWVTTFEPIWRRDQSRAADGQTFERDLGPPLWRLEARTRILRPNEMSRWRARVNAIVNKQDAIYGRPLERTYPISYPRGSWPTGSLFSGTGTLSLIATDRQSVSVSGLPAGFKLVIGDMLAIGTDLHQAVSDSTASSGGVASAIAVVPPVWRGVTTGAPVKLKAPACLMRIDAPSVSAPTQLDGTGAISFRATEAR